MADQRHFPDQQHRSPAVRTVAGRFAPNDLNPVDNSLNVGLGFAVQRLGVGLFGVRITGHYRTLLNFSARLISTTDTFNSVDMGGLPIISGDNTLVSLLVSQLVAGVPSPVDHPPDPDTWVAFSIDFLESSGKG